MTPTTPNNNSARLENKIDDIICSQSELLRSFNEFKLQYTGAHVKLEKDVEAHDERISKVEAKMEKLGDDLDKLKDSVKPLIFQAKILGWLAAAFGFSIIALIWGILTHTVTIVVP